MPQNGDRIVAVDSVTSLHPIYSLTMQCIFIPIVVMAAVWLAWQRCTAPRLDDGRHSNHELPRHRKRSASKKHSC